MELFASQNPRSYSLYFDLKIWFRARNVTWAFEKRAPEPNVEVVKFFYPSRSIRNYRTKQSNC